MEKEFNILNVNKKRMIISFILMLIFYVVLIAGTLFSNYVDSTYNMLKEDNKSTDFAYVVFGLPFLFTIFCSYIFFFLYIQGYYNALIKLNINKPNKFFILFYVSFFVPVLKLFLPIIGIIYLVWSLINIKNKIIIGIVYYLPMLFIKVLALNGVYSKMEVVCTNKLVSYEIINGSHFIIGWFSLVIIMLLMNIKIIDSIKDNNK